jgi:hypothetical protein
LGMESTNHSYIKAGSVPVLSWKLSAVLGFRNNQNWQQRFFDCDFFPSKSQSWRFSDSKLFVKMRRAGY